MIAFHQQGNERFTDATADGTWGRVTPHHAWGFEWIVERGDGTAVKAGIEATIPDAEARVHEVLEAEG